MNKKKNKKKKGFTLIELVIVLAVLAIIALIAIPNFNKVRTDSQKKADERTSEVIERVTTMAIANQDMIVTSDVTFNLRPIGESGVQVTDVSVPGNITWGESYIDKATGSEVTKFRGQDNYEQSLKEVKKPQVKGQEIYKVEIKVDTSGTETVDVKTDVAPHRP